MAQVELLLVLIVLLLVLEVVLGIALKMSSSKLRKLHNSYNQCKVLNVEKNFRRLRHRMKHCGQQLKLSCNRQIKV